MYRWIEGDLLRAELVPDPVALAEDLAGFLAALYAGEPDGPAPGAHSFSRGGPVSTWDEQTRRALAGAAGIVDARGALDVWEAALAARHRAPPVWVHGDVTGANLLVRDGRLAGVLDFGCCAVGDPACDLTIAWTFFAGDGRARLKACVPVEATAWPRARGWALWKALNHLGTDRAEAGRGRGSNAGWAGGSALARSSPR